MMREQDLIQRLEIMVDRDGVEPFWGVCYQSSPLESRTALPFRDCGADSTVQIQYTAERSILEVERRSVSRILAGLRSFGSLKRYGSMLVY
jgi:hypothetical protein